MAAATASMSVSTPCNHSYSVCGHPFEARRERAYEIDSPQFKGLSQRTETTSRPQPTGRWCAGPNCSAAGTWAIGRRTITAPWLFQPAPRSCRPCSTSRPLPKIVGVGCTSKPRRKLQPVTAIINRRAPDLRAVRDYIEPSRVRYHAALARQCPSKY